MRGPKPLQVELSQEERQELEKLVNRHSTVQQIALRGRIILRAARGESNNQISRELGVSEGMVRLWRSRWVSLSPIELGDVNVAERLEDLPRSGAPAKISAGARCKIEQLACEAPEQSGRPITHWTNREIADEIMKRKIVEKISPRHAGRFLKRRGYQTASNPLLAHTG